MIDVPAYLIRAGYSFAVVRVMSVRAERRELPTEEGPQASLTTTIELAVLEPWYGPTYGETLQVTLEEPTSETARLRFPHPYWGYAPKEVGVTLLFWFQAPAEPPASRDKPADVSKRPFGLVRYDAQDPEFVAIRDLLVSELAAANEAPADRRARDIVYLSSATFAVRSFAVQALTSDDLGPDDQARGAAALSRALNTDKNDRIRVDVAIGLGGQAYERTTPAGRTAIVGALLLAAGDAHEDVQRSALDTLSQLEPVDVDALPVIRSAATREAIEERLLEETDDASKARLEAVLSKVSS